MRLSKESQSRQRAIAKMVAFGEEGICGKVV